LALGFLDTYSFREVTDLLLSVGWKNCSRSLVHAAEKIHRFKNKIQRAVLS
jgi:hypothetical protein